MRADQYSRSATLDVRDACAAALARVIAGIDVVKAGQRVKFAAVFDEWPNFEDKYETPAACVLAPPSWDYSDAIMTPRLLETDTIESVTTEPSDPPSFGLWKTAEMLDQFQVSIRAGSTAMRSLLKLAIEEAFQMRELTMNPNGQRYGLLVDLPEYWGMTARASLLNGSNSDNEDSAARNQREATFTVSMQAPKVQLGPVYPFTVTLTEKLATGDGRTVSTDVVTFTNGTRS
jgi:hypothetical protein